MTPEGDLIVAAVGSGIALGGPPPGRLYITESSSGSVLVGELDPPRGRAR